MAGILAAGAYFMMFPGTDWSAETTKIVEDFSKANPIDNEDDLPLEKYSFPSLQKTFNDSNYEKATLRIGEAIDLGVTPTVYTFTYSDTFAPDKRISGTVMLPAQPGTYPVIILYRGWADEDVYYSGYGTKNAAAYFAQRGYITVAPDFLGYADSDPSSEDFAEARFQTYTSALTLLRSIENLNQAFDNENISYQVDADKVGIWGHSNGGQITLSVLAVTGERIPSTLWAPVTIPFPDNVLHYAGDMDDRGRLLKNLVAEFRTKYNEELYTPTSYLDEIDAPILVHQGSADDSVPKEWNDNFAEKMEELDKDLTYYEYPGVDHNMRPQWGTVISRDVALFNEYLK